jgi:hypothetical protein
MVYAGARMQRTNLGRPRSRPSPDLAHYKNKKGIKKKGKRKK